VAVHSVLDNYAAHKTAAVKQWFLRHPGHPLHFTPGRASWLNQVERFFARITAERIRPCRDAMTRPPTSPQRQANGFTKSLPTGAQEKGQGPAARRKSLPF
jgi:hypothetical protein